MLPLSRVILIGAVAVAVYALDRLTKSWVVANVPLNEARDVVDGWIRIAHVRNTGAAFGLLPERTSILSILSIVAVLLILYYYRDIAARSAPIAATLGMQLGGATGNLVDRIGQGYVVDFVDVGFPDGWRFWAFNVADSSIVVAIFLVTFLLWLEERRPPRASAR
ncbi:MAG: signal peptidase II [Chloroflexi bacterium]|nr:signal peptidase II [Chloroflexota bacterium]